MVLVPVSARDLTGTGGKAPAGASVDVGLLYVDASTEDVLTTRTFPVMLDADGYGEFSVPTSSPGNAYRIRTRGWNTNQQWYVAVPNVAAISLAELIRDHQVDPATLAPGYEAAPGWAVEATELRRLIAEFADGIDDTVLEQLVEDYLIAHPPGDPGREYTFSAQAVWNIPVPAGINRRPSVALYDTTGEEIEADVVVTPTTVTVTFPSPYAGTAVLS